MCAVTVKVDPKNVLKSSEGGNIKVCCPRIECSNCVTSRCKQRTSKLIRPDTIFLTHHCKCDEQSTLTDSRCECVQLPVTLYNHTNT